MSHDELRHALGRLAAEAPIEMRRSEQVWARHRRNRRRHVALTVGSTVAAALALLLAVPSVGDRRGLVTNDPPIPTATPAPERSASATPSPAPAGGGNPGEPTSSPESAVPVVSETPVKRASPRGPAGVVAYMQEHANPGNWVSVDVVPYAVDNGVESFEVDWGDGTTPTLTRVDHCGFELDNRWVYSAHSSAAHQFGAVGEYVVRVTVRFGGCGRPPQTATTTTRVLVDDELVGVNGPATTSIKYTRAELRSDPEPRKVALSLEVTDPDSYVAFAVVEWGDGTVTVLRNGVPGWCKDWPPALDPGFPAYIEHTYAQAGQYSTNASVLVAPCGGGPSPGVSQRLPVTVS